MFAINFIAIKGKMKSKNIPLSLLASSIMRGRISTIISRELPEDKKIFNASTKDNFVTSSTTIQSSDIARLRIYFNKYKNELL